MIKRFEVMWKQDGVLYTIQFKDTSFFLYCNARWAATQMNRMIAELDTKRIAVVMDRRTRLQKSVGLYSDKS